MAITSSATAATSWFDKRLADMSMKELKLAISNAGLRGETEGFVEKQEFIALLNSYFDDVRGQDECPVCFTAMNFGMKSILLPCKHRLCEDCLCSIVTRDELSCSCPLCRASVSKTSLAIGMKGFSLAVKIFHAGYEFADGNELLDREESQLRESLRQDPQHVGFLTALADLIIEKGGDPVEAGMLCRRAIYFEPDNFTGFASLGNVYKSMDDIGASIHCYEKALSLRENNASVMTVLVSVLRGIDRMLHSFLHILALIGSRSLALGERVRR